MSRRSETLICQMSLCGCSSFIMLSTYVIFFCRLLEELIQKEKELQAFLLQAIEEKDQEIKHLKLKSQPIGE